MTGGAGRCTVHAMRMALLAIPFLAAGAGCGMEEDTRPASLRYLQETVFKPSCATAACHSSLNHRADLVLDDPETIYDEVTGQTGVVAFDSDNSGLITIRLTGDDPLTRMPLDAPLPDADIALIARWIDDGAEDN